MEFVSKISDVTEIVKEYLKKNDLKAKNFAELMNVKPSALSRILNKSENMSATTMLNLLNLMGYELVLMNKKEKNLFEQQAYAELYQSSKKFKEEMRKEVLRDLSEELSLTIKEKLQSATVKKSHE